MTFNDGNDELMRAIARLPRATPDAARSERVRARGHAILAARRHRAARAAARPSVVRAFAPGLVGVLCVIYLVSAIVQAFGHR